MKNVNSKRIDVPNELAIELQNFIKNKRPLINVVINALQKNIIILKKEKIIYDKVDVIKQGDYIVVNLGIFSNPAVKAVIFKPHQGTPELIKALLIAFYGEKWKKIYNKYYTDFDKPTINKNIIDNKLLTNNTFSNSDKTYKILILPFRNPDNDFKITNLGRAIKERTQTKSDIDYLGIEILYENSFTEDITFDRAKEIGKEYECDMVIWGRDYNRRNEETHQIYFYYVIINDNQYSNNITLFGKSNKIEINKLFDITEGELYFEIDDIIYWFIGNKNYLIENFKQALKFLNKIKNYSFFNENLYHMISICLFMTESYKKALQNINLALNINPKSYKSILLKANLLSLLKKEISANILYKKLLNYETSDETLHLFTAECILNFSSRNFEIAIKHFEKVIEINPDNTEAHFYLALLYYYLNINLDDIEIHLNYVLAKKIDTPIFNFRYSILFLFIFNDPINSRKFLEKAIEQEPNNSRYHGEYANLLHKYFSEYDKAIEQYDFAIEIDANDIFIIYDYCNFLFKRKIEIEKAQYLFNRLLETLSKEGLTILNIIEKENNHFFVDNPIAYKLQKNKFKKLYYFLIIKFNLFINIVIKSIIDFSLRGLGNIPSKIASDSTT